MAEVSEELKNYSRDEKAKDLYKKQQRVSDLKSKITLIKPFLSIYFIKKWRRVD